VLYAFIKIPMAKGKGDFQYFDPSFDGDIVIANQEARKQPKDKLIYF
jgi:hypothetical protein